MSLTRTLRALFALGCAIACVCALAACQNNGTSNAVAATVDGVSIPEEQVTNTIEGVRAQSGLQDTDAWGQFLASNDLTPEGVREQIVDSLVQQELLKKGAADLGVTVDSTEVDTYVQSMKANYDGDDAWKEALEGAGFTEESYRQSIELSLLQQGVGAHFEESAEISDADIVEAAKTYAPYYDGAKRSSHILFTVDDTSDEAAMAEARTTAQGVLDRINSGELDFAQAAQEYSGDTGSAANGGDVGWDTTSSFVTEYQEALDKLGVGEVSGLVESSYGIHIIKCTDVFTAPEEITSLDQIPEEFRSVIESMAKSTKANSDYTDWLSQMKEGADIKINPMPSNVSYNVDVSKYANAEESIEENAEESIEYDTQDTIEPDGDPHSDASASASAEGASEGAQSASAASAESEGSSSAASA